MGRGKASRAGRGRHRAVGWSRVARLPGPVGVVRQGLWVGESTVHLTLNFGWCWGAQDGWGERRDSQRGRSLPHRAARVEIVIPSGRQSVPEWLPPAAHTWGFMGESPVLSQM